MIIEVHGRQYHADWKKTKFSAQYYDDNFHKESSIILKHFSFWHLIKTFIYPRLHQYHSSGEFDYIFLQHGEYVLNFILQVQ